MTNKSTEENSKVGKLGSLAIQSEKSKKQGSEFPLFEHPPEIFPEVTDPLEGMRDEMKWEEISSRSEKEFEINNLTSLWNLCESVQEVRVQTLVAVISRLELGGKSLTPLVKMAKGLKEGNFKNIFKHAKDYDNKIYTHVDTESNKVNLLAVNDLDKDVIIGRVTFPLDLLNEEEIRISELALMEIYHELGISPFNPYKK